MKTKLTFLAATLAVATASAPCLAQAAPAGKAKGPRPILGRVTTATETTLDIKAMKHGGEGQQVKVALEAGTRVARMEPGTVADLAEGYLVAVAGERQGEKVTATGILRLVKPEGKLKADEMRALMGMARGAGRALAPRGQQPQAAQRPDPPIVGKVTSTQPLTIETLGQRKDDKSEKIEVAVGDETRVFCSTEMKAADLQQGALVMILPKPGSPEDAPVAGAVIQMPQGAGAGAGKAGKAGKKK